MNKAGSDIKIKYLSCPMHAGKLHEKGSNFNSAATQPCSKILTERVKNPYKSLQFCWSETLQIVQKPYKNGQITPQKPFLNIFKVKK